MPAARKKQPPAEAKTPEQVESERVEREERANSFIGASEPTWINPREPLPREVIAATTPSQRTIIDEAMSIFPDVKELNTNLLSAVIVAQALDRLGKRLIEAAAISRKLG